MSMVENPRVRDRRAYKAARPWFWSYACAKQRCTNPRHRSYERYGGRGIAFLLTMKDVEALWWRDGAAMMDKPNLDRINADLDYDLANCRFIEKALNTALANSSRAAARRAEAPEPWDYAAL